MSEKRRFPRIARSLVAYCRKAGADDFERAGLALNISRGGFFIEMEELPAEGDIYELEVNLQPDTLPLRILACAVRIEERGAGFEIAHIEPGDEGRLAAFLDGIPVRERV